MDVDPLASMRCWAITVSLGGRDFDIPAMPAVDWWPVLDDPIKVLDILESSADLDEMMLDGTVARTEISEGCRAAIAEVTGRSFHAALVLVSVANTQWPTIGGTLAQSGFRWDVQPIGAALDAVYAIVANGLEKADLDKFKALIENESISEPGKKAPSKRVVSEFEAMAGPRPAPAPLPGKANAEPSGSQRPKTQPRPRRPRQSGRSAAPRKPPAPRADSGPAASSGSP